MSRQRIDRSNTSRDKEDSSSDNQDNTSSANLTTKLERRRRIEDLNEERRLREESSVF